MLPVYCTSNDDFCLQSVKNTVENRENADFEHFLLSPNVFIGLISLNFFLTHFNPFPNKPWFLRVCSTSLLKTLWEKEKLLIMRNFSFFLSVFYQFQKLSTLFIKFEIVICKLSVWKSLKFVVWERVQSSQWCGERVVPSKHEVILGKNG